VEGGKDRRGALRAGRRTPGLRSRQRPRQRLGEHGPHDAHPSRAQNALGQREFTRSSESTRARLTDDDQSTANRVATIIPAREMRMARRARVQSHDARLGVVQNVKGESVLLGDSRINCSRPDCRYSRPRSGALGVVLPVEPLKAGQFFTPGVAPSGLDVEQHRVPDVVLERSLCVRGIERRCDKTWRPVPDRSSGRSTLVTRRCRRLALWIPPTSPACAHARDWLPTDNFATRRCL